MPSRFEIRDELWAEIEPLIPVRQRRRRYPGRKAIDDRLVLNGILHVLHTGIAWEDLPREYGYGSGRRDRGSSASTPPSRYRASSLCRCQRESPYSAAASVTDSCLETTRRTATRAREIGRAHV